MKIEFYFFGDHFYMFLKEKFESKMTPKYLNSVTTSNFSVPTLTPGRECMEEGCLEKYMHTVFLAFKTRHDPSSQVCMCRRAVESTRAAPSGSLALVKMTVSST